ncbi:PAS domain-containing protein [Nostoc sp. CENA67]|uniref:histidine kinase n=1 Tax=Amazonocrinis nigriterrae CENA67 TaxID=2794033 RepID=A0A8J7HL07_9NOST|nr:PAS domain-containing protein [Amazonocrinis nigriterrae]MBH8561577.1 PAS domain-containing protein [Amazonocrinis nigriterrae CENA67]
MLELWKVLLAYKQFVPHGHCYLWKPDLVGLHIASDFLIALAYYSIPVTLLYLVRKRQDLPFNWIFRLFATFIVTCGTTHLMEIWTLWYPTYWLSGCIKAITALVSIYTLFSLIQLIPKLLALPSSAQLEVANQKLECEIRERKRAEEALRHSEQRWQLAIAGTNEAIWDWDIPTNETFRSDRWFKMLGYDRHELSNSDDEWDKRIHPEDYERVNAAQTAYLLRKVSDYNTEYRLLCKDGNYRWFRSRAQAVWDEQGNPVRLVGSLADVSDRKQAELALQEREAMLRRIGDNLPNGAVYQVVRELDGSDHFSYLSAGIERLMEVKAEDALLDASLLYRQFIPEDVPHLQTAVEQSRQKMSIFDIQLRIQTPSGKLKWFHFRSTPRRLQDSRVVWDGLVVDVTALKRTEERLRKSKSLLEESQRVARLGNWEFDLASQKITWSKQLFELFNRDPGQSEPTYQENLQLYYPEDAGKLAQAIERAIATGESYKLILRVSQSDGSTMYTEGIGHAELNANGEVIRLYGTAQDVTERQAVLNELQQAQEKLRRSETLLASAQHIAHIGSWEWHLEPQKQIWSTETFRIFGLNPTQSAPTQAEFMQLVHPDDRPALQTHFVGAIAQGTPFNVEYRIFRLDGSLRYLESRAEVVYDPQERTVRLHGAILDITERKQTELEITKSRDLLEAVYNESADALFLVDPETGLTTDCNNRAVELFKAASKAELIGIAGHTLQKVQFTPDEITSVTEEVNQQGVWSREIEYVTKQGNCFWGNIAVKRIQVVGQVMNLVRVTDISARKRVEAERQQVEAALAKSEEQLRLTLEFNQIGTWDWDVQTGAVIWNDNHFRLLGLEPETSTASYQLWHDAIHPEDIDRVEQMIANALAKHIGYEAEYRVIHPNGKVRWVTGKGRTIYNQVGKPVRMLGVLIDISDRAFAEEALRSSEARFQAFMDNSPVLAWITDAAGRVLYLNQTYLRTFKLLSNQVIGRSIFDLYSTEIAQQHFDNIQTVIQTNQVLEVIEISPRPDGTLGEFLVYKFPIPGLSAQKLVGRVAIDITERKTLERELAHKQQLLDAFITSAPVGMTVLDQELRYSLINEALAQINGIPAKAHIGKTQWEIVPDLAPKQEEVLRHVLTTGEPILDFELSGETAKLPGVIRTWLASYFPICSVDAKPVGVGIVVLEISDRKRAEQMLELQAVITRNMAEGICLVSAADGSIVYANPKFEQMFGYAPDELTRQHVSIVNYGDENISPEDVNQAIRTAVLQQGEATYEVHNVKKDGTPFWSSATTCVFDHPEYGKVLVAVQQDITEQKQAQEQIKASLKEKEVLLKEIHHRVKNNLGIVSSLLQMQCRRTKDAQATAILRDSQNRIASISLVHEKLYRSEDLANIDFAQYIPDLTTHLFDSYNVSSSQIKLNIQVDGASLDIETAIPCGLIINELVSNALKYAFVDGRAGEILVKLSCGGDRYLTLIVRDNGVGLPADFDSRKAKTLGISLIQGLIKQLRGNLEINCEQGTEFKIIFPKGKG